MSLKIDFTKVAPRRKTDPGELFDWPRLARAGIGLWPEHVAEGDGEGGDIGSLLTEFGYETVDLGKTVEAFQRRICPARIDGIADGETVARLHGALQMARGLGYT